MPLMVNAPWKSHLVCRQRQYARSVREDRGPITFLGSAGAWETYRSLSGGLQHPDELGA